VVTTEALLRLQGQRLFLLLHQQAVVAVGMLIQPEKMVEAVVVEAVIQPDLYNLAEPETHLALHQIRVLMAALVSVLL
jgi:hypothetical protein